jgi:hypothetical protein
MTRFSRDCLEDVEAVTFAEQFYSEMMVAQSQFDIGDPQAASVPAKVRAEYRETFPDYAVVRDEILRSYLTKAALAGAGYVNTEDVPQEIKDIVWVNEDAFEGDIRDLYERNPDGNMLTGFTYRFWALEPEAIKEMLAHHFVVVGKLSRHEFEEKSRS